MDAAPQAATRPSLLARLTPEQRAVLKRWTNRVGAGTLGSVTGSEATGMYALTFDDGPCPAITPQLLDTLRAHDATATFFVLVQQAREYPEIVRRMLAEGHEVGLHGVDHTRITGRSHKEALAYLREAKAELEGIAGSPIRLYRPPYGSQSASTFIAARRAGLEVVVWDGEATDWIDRDVATVVEEALGDVAPGGILLLHDRIEPDPRSPDAAPTTFDRVTLVDDILRGTASKGLRTRTVGELVAAGAERRTVWLHR